MLPIVAASRTLAVVSHAHASPIHVSYTLAPTGI
jgi:hypothetical protein